MDSSILYTNTRLSSRGKTRAPVIGHVPFLPPLLPDSNPDPDPGLAPGSPGSVPDSESSLSSCIASHPHRQQTTQPVGNTAGFCHGRAHKGHLPNDSGVTVYSTADIPWGLSPTVSLGGGGDIWSLGTGGLEGGVGRPEGRIGKGRGGRIDACVRDVDTLLVLDEMARGEEGEYHH